MTNKNPVARVHVDNFDPEVYFGDGALETALAMARQMREDFPDAIVGVSYNPAAAEDKRRRTLYRWGVDVVEESSDVHV